MKYLCMSSNCSNEIHPCIDCIECSSCKILLLKTSINDLNINLPIELVDKIFDYIIKTPFKKCPKCSKFICTKCSKYYMPWCCLCLIDFFND
jgi:hypothetical protein